VKWRFSAPAGDVEESKLCLFSVIMPAKCVSSVSPRFHTCAVFKRGKAADMFRTIVPQKKKFKC
jgi:hypothetical protein